MVGATRGGKKYTPGFEANTGRKAASFCSCEPICQIGTQHAYGRYHVTLPEFLVTLQHLVGAITSTPNVRENNYYRVRDCPLVYGARHGCETGLFLVPQANSRSALLPLGRTPVLPNNIIKLAAELRVKL